MYPVHLERASQTNYGLSILYDTTNDIVADIIGYKSCDCTRAFELLFVFANGIINAFTSKKFFPYEMFWCFS